MFFLKQIFEFSELGNVVWSFLHFQQLPSEFLKYFDI
jgi:hypothetical protein